MMVSVKRAARRSASGGIRYVAGVRYPGEGSKDAGERGSVLPTTKSVINVGGPTQCALLLQFIL